MIKDYTIQVGGENFEDVKKRVLKELFRQFAEECFPHITYELIWSIELIEPHPPMYLGWLEIYLAPEASSETAPESPDHIP